MDEPTQTAFEVGERVLFETSKLGIESASLSINGMVARLNNKPFISATVLSCETLGSGALWVCIRPDGWPLPDTMWPHGFFTMGSRLQKYEGETVFGVTVTDDSGRALSADVVREMVLAVIRKGPDWLFDKPQWEVLSDMETQAARPA